MTSDLTTVARLSNYFLFLTSKLIVLCLLYCIAFIVLYIQWQLLCCKIPCREFWIFAVNLPLVCWMQCINNNRSIYLSLLWFFVACWRLVSYAFCTLISCYFQLKNPQVSGDVTVVRPSDAVVGARSKDEKQGPKRHLEVGYLFIFVSLLLTVVSALYCKSFHPDVNWNLEKLIAIHRILFQIAYLCLCPTSN